MKYFLLTVFIASAIGNIVDIALFFRVRKLSATWSKEVNLDIYTRSGQNKFSQFVRNFDINLQPDKICRLLLLVSWLRVKLMPIAWMVIIFTALIRYFIK